MTEHYDDKSSAEIQQEIDHTRAEMSETIEALRNRLSPGELVDQAMTYLKDGGAGQFTSNLGETVKQNPVPTALIGIGIAWLMMGGSRGSQPTSSWERSSGFTSRIRGAASGTSERAGEMMQSARASMGRAREQTGDMAQGAGHQMRETADQVRHQARSQAERARQSFTYLRREQPLVLGALGFALGAALGAGLPPTEREDELMGETRDQYMQQAREFGEEQLDKARQVATTAASAAQEQLQKEGVTSGSTDEQARQAADKAERVAHASRDAAEEEARQQGLT